MNSISSSLSSTIFVHILSALFGISSWIAINGLWVETPILVNVLPESWQLASYITLISQLANVGPLVYWLVKRFNLCKNHLEQISIHLICFIGVIALILLAFFWQNVTSMGAATDGGGQPQQHSVAFLVLTFFLAIVDCTSSVLYIPFMSNIPHRFLVSHLIGQALSGLIPSFIALAQGVGGNPECVPDNNNGTTTTIMAHAKYPKPRFSVQVFMLLCAVLAIISWLSFVCLVKVKKRFNAQLVVNTSGDGDGRSGEQQWKTQVNPLADHDNNNPNNHTKDEMIFFLSNQTVLALLVAEAVICSITNGILPSIQPYSVLYYGNVTYHFAVTLAVIATPIGCMLTMFTTKRKFLLLKLSLLIGTLCAVYILIAALHSPRPLIDNNFGRFFIVLMWIGTRLLLSYARTIITEMLRSQHNNHRLLFKGGVFTQLGSAIGSIVMFFLVNYTKLFVSYNPCG